LGIDWGAGATRVSFIIVTTCPGQPTDVRIASVWALIDFKDAKSLDQAPSMLRDPVNRVRNAAATALGTHCSKIIIKELNRILFDENEVSSEANFFTLLCNDSGILTIC